MGKEQGQVKANVTSTTAGPAPATPGRQTQPETHGDAGGDLATATPTSTLAGFAGFPKFPMPAATKRHPVDLTVHAPDYVSDAMERFRAALDKGDKEGAEHAWQFAPPKDKRAFGAGSSINRDLVQMVRVIGPMTIHVMADAGLDFDGRGDLIELMLQVGMPFWFDSLALHGGALLMSFLDHLPRTGTSNPAELKKLQRIMHGTNSLALAKPLFERIYVPLANTTYNPNKVRTTAWQADYIHRLYDVLSTHLPVSHVRTVKAFHLGVEEYKGGAWKTLKHAWWSSAGYVVLPVTTAKDGGTMDHGMTGGGHAHKDPATQKGTTEGKANKFDVGALHEVGHAVGDAFGLHDLALKNTSVDWHKGMSADAWSKALWGDDTALTTRASRRSPEKVVSAAEARTYMAQSLSGRAKVPSKWNEDELIDSIKAHYGDQPLTKYWEKWVDEDDKSNAYQFSGRANYGNDGRVYVYCTRGGAQLSSYKQEAHQQKVSWYSLSSPHEWWAEQYAHFYRTGKTGAGLDAATAKTLAEIDTKEPTTNVAPAQAGAAPSEDYDGESETQNRLPFPW